MQGERETKQRIVKKTNSENTAAVRASISFPREVYDTLEMIAQEKKVSLAWVVREAAEKYIGEKWPLLKGHM
jgi:metal-responsive CopG/Arc/MetJ family transcriptional regulator